MRVRMKVDVSGARDGQPWPGRGKAVDLPDEEAASLCAAGMAEPVADTEADVERAVPADDAEKRVLTTETAGAVTPGAAEKKESAPAPAKKTAAKRATAKPQPGDK